MVLGELIEQESGKITGRRVLDVEGPKTESSFTMNGKWVGQDVTDIGTYWGVMREGTEAQGVVYGEAQGVATTKDGQGMATYKVQGIGIFNKSRKNKIPWISILSVQVQQVEETHHPLTIR